MTSAERKAEIEKLYRKNFDLYCGLAWNYLHNTEEAMDVVQKAACIAFEKIDKIKSDKNLSAWLYRIVLNTTRNQYRKNKRIPGHCTFDAVEYAEYTQSRAPKEFKSLDFNREFSDEVLDSLNEINPVFREVIVLVDLAEMQYREAAQILGIPHGTVMSRLWRGRKILRNKLQIKGVIY